MSAAPSNEMKPQTAAKKLNIYLPAAPEEFRGTPLSHEACVELQTTPPAWRQPLRREGPHPRAEVARKLGVTITALKNNDMDRPLTTAEIKALLADQPEWLRTARTALAENRGA
jgi:aminoglycoside phosphotransferase (APT) family kinase protein